MLNVSIKSILEFFSEPSAWYNLVALSLAIVSLFYGFIRDYVQSKKKEPVYWIRTTHLMRETIKDVKGLRILYNGAEINGLASTRFVFWNKGKEAIKHSDIASKNPIKITIDSSYEILDAFIDGCTDEDNNFTIKKDIDSKSILIDFEFMEKNDGISLKLIHTAPSSNSFNVTGKVISGSSIEYTSSASYSNLPILSELFPLRRKTGYYIFKGSFIIMGLLLFMSFFGSDEIRVDSYIIRSFFMLIGVIYIYVGLFIIRRRIPDKLDLG